MVVTTGMAAVPEDLSHPRRRAPFVAGVGMTVGFAGLLSPELVGVTGLVVLLAAIAVDVADRGGRDDRRRALNPPPGAPTASSRGRTRRWPCGGWR